MALLKPLAFIHPKPKRLPERKAVTIAAGILCPDGIVLCADTQETIGSFKRHRPKLEELTLASADVKAVVVGSTDDTIFLDALIERISHEIDLSDGCLVPVRKAIEKAVHEYCNEVLHLYATQADRPIAHLLIGLKTVDDLALLEVRTPNVTTVKGLEFIGNGSDLALYKAKHFVGINMPVEVAAGVAAYILEVVKDNNTFCGGHTQMAVIRSDGTVDHKTAEFSRRIGVALQKYDTFVSRMGAVLPFLSAAGGTVVDMILTAEGETLNDKAFDVLFAALLSADATTTISGDEWVKNIGAIKRGFLNWKDAEKGDALAEANILIKQITASDPPAVSPELKQTVNDLIHAYNTARTEYFKWRDAAKLLRPDKITESETLNQAMLELRDKLNALKKNEFFAESIKLLESQSAQQSDSQKSTGQR